MNRKTLSLAWLYFIFLSSAIDLTSQKVFDVSIEKLQIDKYHDLEFVIDNEGENLACWLMLDELNEFKHKFIIDECSQSDESGIEELKLQDLIEFNNSSEFIEFLKNKRFSRKILKRNNKLFHEYLQTYDNELVAVTKYLESKNADNTPRLIYLGYDIYKYSILRINNKYMIAVLHQADSLGDPDIDGFVIPRKKESLALTYGTRFLLDSEEKIDSIIIKPKVNLKNIFRVHKTEEGQQLVDRIFQETLIDTYFDSIIIFRSHFKTYAKGEIVYFSHSGEKINLPRLMAAHDSLGLIQCIIDNEIKWVDNQWAIHDTMPELVWSLCGNTPSTNRKIHRKNSSFFELKTNGLRPDEYLISNNDSTYYFQEIERVFSGVDTVKLLTDKKLISIKYLSEDTLEYYDGHSDLETVFSFPRSFCILNYGSYQKLVSIVNQSEEKIKKLNYELWRVDDSSEKDSLRLLIANIQSEVEIKEIFSGNLQSTGYYHPIKFERDGLFGYYPQNSLAEYKVLKPFDFFFAEFEKEDGQIGWIDIYGKEYYKE